jgi:hypothetical protein
MKTNPDQPLSSQRNIYRWIARALGAFLACFWLFILIISLVQGEVFLDRESIIMMSLIAISIAGVAIAWWNDLLGGWLLLIVGTVYSVFAYLAAGHNKGLAMLVSGAPVLITGILFLASAQRSKASSHPK